MNTEKQKEYSLNDYNIAKARLLIFESEVDIDILNDYNWDDEDDEDLNEFDSDDEKQREILVKLRENVEFIRKARIRQSKRKYDNSESGKSKNRARSLKNYYKNKSKKAEN